ncbi:MAG: type IV pilus assembly protein PilM [Patescibacteria group bacterium]|jgi:type IV pilus assembly protein PilM
MALFSSSSSNNYLGIDIGDSVIKMVELSKKGKKIILSNYGFTGYIPDFNFYSSDNIDYLAQAILKLKNELGIKANRATVSLPSFSVFSSVINVNNYDKKKMAERVREEARKVIPLPIEEMVLDWKLVSENEDAPGNAKVFITGSPKKLVKKYIDVFKKTNIFLANLETETFSLIRSLLGPDPSTVMLIELGGTSTNFSIVKKNIPFLNRSINISGQTITEKISQAMSISLEQAEQFKFDLSLANRDNKTGQMPQVVVDAVEPVINEIKYMLNLFNNSNGDRVDKIVLSGGGSLLFNFAEYLEQKINIKVLIGDPWFRVSYPTELKSVLDEVGPKLSIAVGLALRGIE